MDPYTVRLWQAAPWVAVSLLLALVFGRQGALCVGLISAVTALAWVLLVDRYRRRRNTWISAEREAGDKVMDANGLLAFGFSILLTCSVAAFGLEPLLEPEWTAIPLSLPLLGILLSSAIDW